VTCVTADLFPFAHTERELEVFFMIFTTLSPSQEAAFIKPARILVATDLTDVDYLLPHAIAQAKACGANLTFIHAVMPVNSYPVEAGYSPYPEPAAIDQTVRAQLAKLAVAVEREGISCDTSVDFGFGADAIGEKIKSTGATRLIMGSRGHGKWGQLALGSVSNELLGSVSIPIFVIGPHAAVTAAHTTPQRILHPISLNGDYKKSFAIAAGLADCYQAELTLLHVDDREVEKEINPARTLAWTETAMMSLLPTGSAGGHPVHAHAVCGSVVTETLEAATKANADWIVLGVEGGHGYLPFRNNIASKVIAAATCCVLIVRHDSPRVAEKIGNEVPSSAVMA
jgi:nucleotide-binding universal stress UspA family protein